MVYNQLFYFHFHFQAVKYLERMLIQAQNQKEQQLGKPSPESDEAKAMASSDSSDSDVKIKTESGTDVAEAMAVDENLPGDIMSDVEMKDLSERKVVKTESGEEGSKVLGNSGGGDGSGSDTAEGIRKDTADSDLSVAVKDINIDPKTYCKLGHFHLLLEDYEKGTF